MRGNQDLRALGRFEQFSLVANVVTSYQLSTSHNLRPGNEPIMPLLFNVDPAHLMIAACPEAAFDHLSPTPRIYSKA